MFVGYSNNHTGDTYEMWDPMTNSIHTTRDIQWLNRMYYSPMTLKVIPTETNTTDLVFQFDVTHELMFPDNIPAGENVLDNAENDAENKDEIEPQNEDNYKIVNNENKGALVENLEGELVENETEDSLDADEDVKYNKLLDQLDESILEDEKTKPTTPETMDRGSDADTIPAENLTRTQSGRLVIPPRLLINEMAALSLGETALSTISKEELEEEAEVNKAEINYVNRLQDIDENELCGEIVTMSIDEHPEPEFKEFVKEILSDVKKFEIQTLQKLFQVSILIRMMYLWKSMQLEQELEVDLATQPN